MVMCKYFLRGTCRFGDSCKNEHSYNDTSGSIMRKKTDIDINVLIKAVSNDMDKAEKGNQWPLSCYGPFQAKPCFPGFEDKCFEEIRLGMYEAEKSGAVEQYKQQLTQILHEARMKMRSLQNPTAEASHVLQELYNTNTSPEQQSVSNVFSNNTNTFSNTPIQANTNTFSNSPIQSNSIFSNNNNNNNSGGGGAPNNIFTNQTTQSFTFAAPENKSIFGNTAPNKNSIFTGGGGGSSIFSGNQAQQQQPQPQSFQSTNIFKTANNSIFGGVQQPNPQTTSNIFMQNNQQEPPPNPFKQQNIQAPTPGQSPFGAVPVQQQQSPFVNQQPTFNTTNQLPTSPFGSCQPTNAAAFVVPPFQSPFNRTGPSSSFAGVTLFNEPPSFPTIAAAAPPPAVVNQSPFAAAVNTQQTPFAANTQQTPFTAAANTQQTPFAAAANSQQTPFVVANQSPFAAAAPQPSSVITENRSIFAQNNQTNTTSDYSRSIFGSSQSTVVAAADTSVRQDDATIYSKLETLTEDDVKYFEASIFEFGKIPDKPPTLQMCS